MPKFDFDLGINLDGLRADMLQAEAIVAGVKDELKKPSQPFPGVGDEIHKFGDEAQKAKNNTKALNDELNKTAKTVSPLKGIFSSIKQQLLGFVAVTAVIAGLRQVFISIVQTTKEFESAVSSLSAITGATGQDLQFLKEQAISIGKETGKSATEVVKAFELIGSKRAELLKNKEALSEVTKQAIILSQAAGIDLSIAAEGVTAVLNQFGAEANQTSRIINVLAAGSQAGAAEVASLTESMKQAGTVAAAAGLSIEETVGALETLGEKQLLGAEAGTGLRNVLLILQEKGIGVTNGVFNLKNALDELAVSENDNVKLLDLFGRQNVTAGQILIQNRERFSELTTAVTGTNTALEQQATQMDNLAGDQAKLEASTEALTLALATGEGSLANVLRFVTQQARILVEEYIRLAMGAEAYREQLEKNALSRSFQEDIAAAVQAGFTQQEALKDALETNENFLKVSQEQLKTLLLSGKEDKAQEERIVRNIDFAKKKIELAKEALKTLEKEAAAKVIADAAAAAEITQFDALKQKADELRKILLDQSLAGEINNKTLNEYLDIVKRLEAAEQKLSDITSKRLNPLEKLNKKIAELKEQLLLQALAGELNVDTLEKYKKALEQLETAQTKVADAIKGKSVFLVDENAFGKNLSTIEDFYQQEQLLNEQRFLKGEISEGLFKQERLRITIETIDTMLKFETEGTAAFIELQNQKLQAIKDFTKEVEDELKAHELTFGQKIGKLFGIEPDKLDDVKQALSSFVNEMGQIIQAGIAQQIALNQQVIDSLNNRVQETERALDRELELNKQGFASNVQAKRDELKALQDARKQALKDQREALKTQQALETVSQAISIATAAANIIKGFSNIPIVGVVLGALAAAAMLAAFLSAKSQANAAAQSQQAFYEGGEYGYTGDGNPRQESRRLGKKPYTYHKGEFIFDHETTQENRDFFHSLHKDNKPGIVRGIEKLLEGTGVKLSPDIPEQTENKIQLLQSYNIANAASQSDGIHSRLETIITNSEGIKTYLENETKYIPLPDGRLEIKKGRITKVTYKK